MWKSNTTFQASKYFQIVVACFSQLEYQQVHKLVRYCISQFYFNDFISFFKNYFIYLQAKAQLIRGCESVFLKTISAHEEKVTFIAAKHFILGRKSHAIVEYVYKCINVDTGGTRVYTTLYVNHTGGVSYFNDQDYSGFISANGVGTGEFLAWVAFNRMVLELAMKSLNLLVGLDMMHKKVAYGSYCAL